MPSFSCSIKELFNHLPLAVVEVCYVVHSLCFGIHKLNCCSRQLMRQPFFIFSQANLNSIIFDSFQNSFLEETHYMWCKRYHLPHVVMNSYYRNRLSLDQDCI